MDFIYSGKTDKLKKMSHLNVVGEVKYLCFPRDKSEISEAYNYAIQKGLKPFPLGGGSNTLIGDVETYLIISDLFLNKKWDEKNNYVTVTPNWNINSLLITAAKKGLYGLEFLAGIPAHLGGLAFMNAGAYGQEISDYFEYIEFFNGKDFLIMKDFNELEYRKSNIIGFITELCLRFNQINKDQIKNQILNNIQNFIVKRKQTQPLEYPNLGCFFKNPQVIQPNGEIKTISAGKLIEQANLKGYTIGGAMVSHKHGNFLINRGDAKFGDFVELIKIVQDTIQEKFNIDLELEVKILNG